MVLPGRELLAGAVEVDESYVGAARPGKRGRGAEGKAIVAIAVEDHNGAPGRARMARIPNVSRETLTDIVLDHIARGIEVRTDAYRGYTTSAATASRTWSSTSRSPATLRTSRCPTSTASRRCSSAGCSVACSPRVLTV